MASIADVAASRVAVSELRAEAERLGFLACGITDLSPPPHATELDTWLARGRAGTMRYLHRQARKRKAPQQIDRDARSVVVLLDNYYTADQAEDRRPPRVAKYARGRDYHRVTIGRLEQLAEFLRRRGARVARVYSDAGPVPERELAQRAGLGWIGKNTMLIRPGAGSFFFIGSVLTDLPFPPDEPFAPTAAAAPAAWTPALPRRFWNRDCSMRRGASPISRSSNRARFQTVSYRTWMAGYSAATSATTSVPGTSGSRPPPRTSTSSPPASCVARNPTASTG